MHSGRYRGGGSGVEKSICGFKWVVKLNDDDIMNNIKYIK